MARKKLQRFAELATMPHVFEEESGMKGQWNVEFGNTQPIILELGCGKGEYTIALAEKYPEANYIGMDKKGERIWVGARLAEKKELEHVRFLRGNARLLDQDFEVNELSQIWLTHPGPFPKESQAHKRLTHPNYIQKYASLLKEDGLLHLKTDNRDLFNYSVEVLKDSTYILEEVCYDIDKRNSDTWTEILAIQTAFEKKHRALGDTIYYLRARNTG